MANRLAGEQSPYLLQHAANPVDWFPWGEEALARAKAEDRPIFLSIGYSACHWCHVMAHESFADPEVADLLNAAFVNIKVDREERPDLDQAYMAACQVLTGGGGWPLSVFLTPDLKPFFAATYIPKGSSLGRTGLMALVPRIVELWRDNRGQVENAAAEVADMLTRPRAGQGGELGAPVLDQAFDQLSAMFDLERGGFGGAPKFPTPHHFTFLLRHHLRSGEASARAMVERTLSAMRLGGIYDHLGRGFHRYSTDAGWLVPHFEKMLYDQAQLIEACIEAWQVTGRREYQDTARETISYVLRDLTDPRGGFYSSEDADSEGEEGKFYLWTTAEVRELLPPDEAEAFVRIFNLRDAGNYRDPAAGGETGRNIIHLTEPLAEAARRAGMDPASAARLCEGGRRKLWRAREDRTRPGKDDKVLTDWNGLMIAALAKAGRAFGESAFLRAADKAARFIRAYLREPGGRLYHCWRQGQPGVPAFLDDYAFLAHGLIELFQSNFDLVHLQDAVACVERCRRDFADPAGGFFFTAEETPGPLGRRKEADDGALPSGNSVMALNLVRLSRLLGRTELMDEAVRLFRAFAAEVRLAPMGYTQMLVALDLALSPGAEVVIAGRRDAADTRALLAAARSGFRPHQAVVLRPEGEGDEIEALRGLAGYVRDMTAVDGRATAYVCRGQKCHQPVTDPAEVEKILATDG